MFESLLENSFICLLIFFLSLPPFLPLSGFSLQDSFEYIHQDPNLGKLNTNQNNLGPCRTGSNLGKIRHVTGLSLSELPVLWVCVLLYYELVVLFCFFFFCIIFNLCLFLCVYSVCPLVCVSVSRSAAGMQQQTAAGRS